MGVDLVAHADRRRDPVRERNLVADTDPRVDRREHARGLLVFARVKTGARSARSLARVWVSLSRSPIDEPARSENAPGISHGSQIS